MTGRPRPRPKPKAPGTSLVAPAAVNNVSSSNAFSAGAKKVFVAEDEDDLFIRNRGRTSKTWAKLEQISKASETKVINVASDSDDEDNGETPRRQNKRKVTSPSWQPKKALDRLLSIEHSDRSGSDDDFEVVGSSNASRLAKKPNCKRQRTRSRSITPPPAVPFHMLQTARALVQTTLNICPRAPSPMLIDDDSDDALFSNPDLARIAQSVARRANSKAPISSPPPSFGDDDVVQLSVRWKRHPQNPVGKEALWIFKMNRDDTFHDLFEATAEEAAILAENLIMMYKGKRIFASITPTTLQIYVSAELVACDKGTYQHMRSHPTVSSHFAFNPECSPTPDEFSDNDSSDPSASHDTQAASQPDDDSFGLILRSAMVKDITVKVRLTTTCGAIVRAFLKKAGIEAQYPEVFDTSSPRKNTKKGGRGQKAMVTKDPRVCIDGDKMDNETEIGEAGLEDGDMVEIVGL